MNWLNNPRTAKPIALLLIALFLWALMGAAKLVGLGLRALSPEPQYTYEERAWNSCMLMGDCGDRYYELP